MLRASLKNNNTSITPKSSAQLESIALIQTKGTIKKSTWLNADLHGSMPLSKKEKQASAMLPLKNTKVTNNHIASTNSYFHHIIK
jgi:hypothetical protein